MHMQEATATQERLEQVAAALQKGTGFVSPYRLGKLESTVRGVTIPPQKIYGYVRHGYIQASLNDLGKQQISSEEAIRHLTKVAEKDIARMQEG